MSKLSNVLFMLCVGFMSDPAMAKCIVGDRSGISGSEVEKNIGSAMVIVPDGGHDVRDGGRASCSGVVNRNSHGDRVLVNLNMEKDRTLLKLESGNDVRSYSLTSRHGDGQMDILDAGDPDMSGYESGNVISGSDYILRPGRRAYVAFAGHVIELRP